MAHSDWLFGTQTTMRTNTLSALERAAPTAARVQTQPTESRPTSLNADSFVFESHRACGTRELVTDSCFHRARRVVGGAL
jgi:hypothetical protein